jgi:O-glycosyl hydrolase
MIKKNITTVICLLFLIFFGGIKVSAQNMINNGNFESDFIDWSNITGGNASATFSVSTTAAEIQNGSKAMKVVVATAGTNAYDIQSIHAGWAAVNGTSYTLTLWAKASTNRAQLKLVMQNVNYSEKIISLTTTYAQYTWTFTASENGTRFRLNFPQAGTFNIDNINITDPNPVIQPATTTLTVIPATTYQTMEGFGGAMTWYSDWIMAANTTTKDQLYQLLFNDLGLDILRLKNWYFPTNYPSNKSTVNLPDINTYNATIEFYKKAKAINPNIDVLLCSWTPPVYLKSNGAANAGTLKKNTSGKFMYSEYAQYWIDMLDAYKTSGMTPDFISMQNEPGFENTGWETCGWRPTETATYPSYGTAFDSVYNRIKSSTNAPKMIGPEVENIGYDADINANTFTGYTDPIKSKTGLYAYAYHLYNFGSANESTIMSAATKSLLNTVKSYSDKQNFMTEFGTLDWYNAALMIQQSLTQANASAYIHWELVWQDNTETAISLTTAGTYSIKPPYYTIKHFAKCIDKGYTRIEIASTNPNVVMSAFKNPTKNQITIVAINRATAPTLTTLNIGTLTKTGIQAYQSVNGNYYQTLTGLTATSPVSLAAQSITTIVVDYTDPAANILPTVSITSPANNAVYSATATITIIATADDVDGTISKVDFYNGTTLLGSDATSPYSFAWANIIAGTYSITAKATDNKNGVTISSPITIMVNPVQTISLNAGWNLISTNVYPIDSSITTLFTGLNVQEIKTADVFWEKGQNSVFNRLTTLVAGNGYFVKMNVAGLLRVTGKPMSTANYPSPTLKTGWNMLGCPFQTNTALSSLFNNTNSKMVKNFDGFWISGGSTNSIQNLEPGKGYFLKKN